MNRAEGSTPSPIVTTLLNRQDRDGFDTIVVSGPPPTTHAVVFLHGSGGNFTLQCWMVAQAAARAGAATFCPSTRFTGDWWTGPGPAIARETLDDVRARGFDRIVLAGLSNGGVGASRLAPQLRGGIVGLLLVSGAAPDAPAAGVPTLALQGAHDGMMTPRVVRTYAERTGATYVELEGTHFVLIEQPEVMTERMGRWLGERFGG
jgi:pimeloyl-ACP methyl ester carboxylesterase